MGFFLFDGLSREEGKVDWEWVDKMLLLWVLIWRRVWVGEIWMELGIGRFGSVLGVVVWV